MTRVKKKVESTDLEGNEVTVYVVSPSEELKVKADKVNKRTFAKIMNETDENGKPTAILRARLYEYARQQGLWSDELQQKKDETIDKINDNLEKLDAGGFYLKDARELAIEVVELRNYLAALEYPLREIKRYSLESQCEDAEYHFLASQCIVDEEGNPKFEKVDDLVNSPNHPWVIAACRAFSSIHYNLDEDWEKELPENKFLLKYKFVDEDMNFIDKDGNKITRDGTPVSELEKPEVEHKPFLDEDGNPVE